MVEIEYKMDYIESYSYKITNRDNHKFNVKKCPLCNHPFVRFYYDNFNDNNMFFHKVKTICPNKHTINNSKNVNWSS